MLQDAQQLRVFADERVWPNQRENTQSSRLVTSRSLVFTKTSLVTKRKTSTTASESLDEVSGALVMPAFVAVKCSFVCCIVLFLLTNMPPQRNWQHTVRFDDGSTYTGAGATRKDVGTARSPQPTGTATRACARTTRRTDTARRLSPQGELRGRKLRWQEAWARYQDLGQWGQVRWRGARWQRAWAGHAHWAPGELLRGRGQGTHTGLRESCYEGNGKRHDTQTWAKGDRHEGAWHDGN